MRKKVVALVSGGLDSILAAKLMKEQDAELVILNFKTPFCQCDKKSTHGGCHNEAAKVAQGLGAQLKTIFMTDDYFRVLKKPKHGYGSNMNPCIDCRILMYGKAKEYMNEIGADFMVTGEVLGQRPMSQHRRALDTIEKEAGLEGLILRPLSAKLLPETKAEKEGLISREELKDFSGRTRRPQMELAEKYDIKDYPCSAGGCLLTDPAFSKRVKDLVTHDELNLNEIELIKTGRYFRLSEKAKLLVGRNENENGRLAALAREGDWLFSPAEIAGPTAVGRGEFDEKLIALAASIVCRYCDLEGKTSAEITCGLLPAGEKKSLNVSPSDEKDLAKLRV